MLNNVILMGRLTADPEVRSTNNGAKVANFTIAVDRDYAVDGNRPTDFFNVNAWNKTAETVEKYFHKGMMAIVEGSIEIEPYTDKDGNNRRATRIRANRVRFGEPKRDNATATTATAATPNTTNDDYAPIEDGDLPF